MLERYSTPDMRRLWSEAERYRTWLEVELAATAAWEDLGEVPAGTAAALRRAAEANPLDDAFAERVATIEAETRHDIVAFTRALSERLGDGARYVHYGLTSTDVVDTAQNIVLTKALSTILEATSEVKHKLRALAQRYRHLPCIGRTHGIHAEPMTFGLKFLNFAAAFERDEARLERAKEAVSVVMLSGSVGTYAHVPPAVEIAVAEALGLTPDPITNQTVARDRHAEVMAALAILGTSIERVAIEIRHLQRTEVREAQEGFTVGQTGSSSMPHKKNPIASENLTGVARIMRSNLQAALENVAGLRGAHGREPRCPQWPRLLAASASPPHRGRHEPRGGVRRRAARQLALLGVWRAPASPARRRTRHAVERRRAEQGVQPRLVPTLRG